MNRNLENKKYMEFHFDRLVLGTAGVEFPLFFFFIKFGWNYNEVTKE